MKGSALDYTNIFLMLGSAVLAFFLPFWLFLFAYAVLGPLHYLTEIPWLHRKNYFTKQKGDYRFLVAGTLLLFTLSFFSFTINTLALVLLFLFFLALIMNTVGNGSQRTALILLMMFGLWVTVYFPVFTVIAILIPTVIHVFIFTGCFLLYGALRSKSVSGLISVGVFILAPIALALLSLHSDPAIVSESVKSVYALFELTNLTLMQLLHISVVNAQEAIYASLWGLAIMKFIAYAYTYHYLNWFSKTKIIAWHVLPKEDLAMVILLWLFAVGIYAYDYRICALVLYFLSLLHVVLEFPLNHQTFIGIYGELKARVVKS